ncbi:MAG: aconitase family protein [Candidatus Zixiibacteriota bacterium]
MPRTKIPTKAELIQLQRLYKTDEKIAERLGGVTAHLVAYWRRKKNVPRNTFPKFSEREVRDLWERFGDDYRCGLEIGISKAAFYNWRRKYNILEKPAFLKLEQLELNLDDSGRAAIRRANYGRQTISQKILAEKAEKAKVEPGETVSIEPDLAICDDNSSTVVKQFRELGVNFVWNPGRVIIVLNETGADITAERAADYFAVREFARRQNIKHFFDSREGACHQIILERGQVLPGQFAAGSEQFAVAHGAIGSFAFNIGIAHMANLWAKGKVSLSTPRTVKVVMNGKMQEGVTAQDIALWFVANAKNGAWQGQAIEFYGSTVPMLSMSDRFNLAHQSATLGVHSAIFPFDAVTRRFLHGRTKMPYRPALADKDAVYADELELTATTLTPQIARVFGSGKVMPVEELLGTSVQKIILGSCANGRFDDLKLAADIIKGKKIHPDVRFYVLPGSRSVYLEALKKGLIRAFIEAGAIVMNPGALHPPLDNFGFIAGGERCLASSYLSASPKAEADSGELLVASPATCAASALKGEIVHPASVVK